MEDHLLETLRFQGRLGFVDERLDFVAIPLSCSIFDHTDLTIIDGGFAKRKPREFAAYSSSGPAFGDGGQPASR